ncbi:MAG: hypothetical protein CMJ75_16170 [Planctomycetaceae bacterium]|nr:hypothetical protein [Planctomycetaceae bacterium]
MNRRTDLSRHKTRIKGEEYLRIHGLLALASDHGLEEIHTVPIKLDPEQQLAIFSAVARGSRGSYSAHAVADPSSLSGRLLASWVQVAESRAVARALRHYCGIGATAGEDERLPGGD